jgi:phosphopantothenoylcysteine synthetase/decarboxylase
MNLLVTAGNTQVPIDKVRAITNVFTGRTGAAIALHAHSLGHTVTLLTSHAEAVTDMQPDLTALAERWSLIRYRTFSELEAGMAEVIPAGDLDVVIQCAAVSDYLSGGVYAPAEGTRFRPDGPPPKTTLESGSALEGGSTEPPSENGGGSWEARDAAPRLESRAASKVKSDEPELWLRLVRAPKLIDRIRTDWNFRGLLVKFKLEVAISDQQLLEIAERSRVHSGADLMVANTFGGAGAYVYLGPLGGSYECVTRRELPARLLAALVQLHRERGHG